MKTQNKKIEKIPIKLPNHNHQPSSKEMREEVNIPTTPDNLARMLVKDYEIEYEKE